MAKRNQGFAAGLAANIAALQKDAAPASHRPTETLVSRGNTLAELSTGVKSVKTQQRVDPAKCKMWVHHNRDYGALDYTRCQDLIESIKAQGKQEVPAIVRRLTGDPDYDFEVICGARRHWSVSWLRQHNYPEIGFFIEAREITDEEAFRISDLENRAREDLTDFERARDYLRALEQYYGGKQKDMAERLNVTPSWLSRYLDLARLPFELVQAFQSPHDLRIKHVTQLKPLMKPPVKYEQVERRAAELAKDVKAGGALSPAEVIKQLAIAYKGPQKVRIGARGGGQHETIMDKAGKPIMTVHKPKRGEGVSITLIPDGKGNRAEVLAAFKDVLTAYWPE
ncbi:ParB/RepB/Spo0J family partition protein [Novosphingobium taihuense]|uniref:ParB family chromosome partitioning protein n=1 Tax=Novosphingobium taihuense TaxID=260085 RepID=A0A7W7AGT6_9SPHN|nr:ParB/RepB/Spo0J family partition protein [Novosphingobium taihuense]MBB4615777.1 ParB family chromosome partitioning protein [Novosphingobium taihuense]TWH79692.1 ParB family chromosome partitioning protein [Novosphingobium taihuense]